MLTADPLRFVGSWVVRDQAWSALTWYWGGRDELVARTRTQVRRKRYEEGLRESYMESMNAAVTDSPTGLYNRRYLESHFDRVCKPLTAASKPVSVMMLDIDHFKAVNDTHCHDAGDEVLRGMGERLHGNLRGFDTAVRYGGEEFVVLMPDAPSSAAAAAAGVRLCEAIADSPFKVSDLADGLPVTISIGVATAMAGSETLEQLLKRADEALYEAKNAGRNRVVVAPEDGATPEDGENRVKQAVG